MNICAISESGIEGDTPNAKIAAAVQNKPNTRFWRNARGVAAREFIAIAKRIAGVEVDDKASVGFFTRIGRALGLSATPA